MSEQENKETTEVSGNLSKSQTEKEETSSYDDGQKDSASVDIKPSEPQDQKSETGNQSGDPGRTPGKAEG